MVNVKTRMFSRNPVDEFLNLFVSEQARNGVEMVLEFSFREDAVDLTVTYPMKRHSLFTLEGLRDEVVLVERAFDKLTGT